MAKGGGGRGGRIAEKIVTLRRRHTMRIMMYFLKKASFSLFEGCVIIARLDQPSVNSLQFLDDG